MTKRISGNARLATQIPRWLRVDRLCVSWRWRAPLAGASLWASSRCRVVRRPARAVRGVVEEASGRALAWVGSVDRGLELSESFEHGEEPVSERVAGGELQRESSAAAHEDGGHDEVAVAESFGAQSALVAACAEVSEMLCPTAEVV